MSSEESFSGTGIALPTDENGNTDSMGILTHAVVEDIFYNIIHGIVLKTHRDEKIARANSAAIIVTQKAETLDSNSRNKPIRVSTDSAVFEDSTITISGNPLENLSAKELRCPKCGLPRLLHPTSGNASQPPDSEIEYCTKHPFIDKPGHDIYGQLFPVDATGPGKGKKKSQISKLGGIADSADTSNAQSPAASPPPSSQQSPLNTFPNVKCPKCARPLAIRRFAAHLGKCIGGRPSGRAAQLKINGTTSASTPSSNTPPPNSRKGTPVPPVPSNKKAGTSQKREAPEFDENEDSEEEPKKKKRKLPITTKKNVNTSFGKGASNGVTKKWKSGRQTGPDGKIKVTLNNNSQRNPPSMPTSDAEGEQEEKFLRPNGDKTESVSSQTLSSPS